ncbi:MAG: hypothetical protein N3B10_04740 [Armatimonadetes bacterium]|nr:hypothetical protein [Armatimonadota bacterium]
MKHAQQGSVSLKQDGSKIWAEAIEELSERKVSIIAFSTWERESDEAWALIDQC